MAKVEGPTNAVAAAILDEAPREVPQDKLAQLRDAARRQYDINRAIATTEAALKVLQKQALDIAHRELPELFEAAGVDIVGLGDLAIDARLEPFYRANISADWPAEKRNAAFEALFELGAGDLIKTIITLEFGKGDHERAVELEAILEDKGFDYSSRLGVPWQSLTAFVKEQVEAGNPKLLGYLERIGATVGKIVRLKEKKDRHG